MKQKRGRSLVEPLEARRLFAAWPSASSFGDHGVINTDFPGGFVEGDSIIATQADGKTIFATGHSIGRINSDGTPDTTFGDHGSLTLADNYFPSDLQIDPAGDVLVCGAYFSNLNGLKLTS